MADNQNALTAGLRGGKTRDIPLPAVVTQFLQSYVDRMVAPAVGTVTHDTPLFWAPSSNTKRKTSTKTIWWPQRDAIKITESKSAISLPADDRLPRREGLPASIKPQPVRLRAANITYIPT